MRPLLRMGSIVVLALCGLAGAASAQPVKNRISVLVDSSGSMVLTPAFVTFTDNCAPFDPCAFNGNITTAAQRTCNSCVADTITFDNFCNTFWDATCRTEYTNCVGAVTGQACTRNMSYSDGVSTRGDGSNDLTGCDVNGDGAANDSRMFQAKEALQDVTATFGEVEFALWRYRQVTGGQACTVDAQCPRTPGNLAIMACEDQDNNPATSRVCAMDADLLDNATTAGFEGQCNRFTYTGAPGTFTCNVCNALNSYDRAGCNFFDLDRVRTGGISSLNGTAVTCFPAGAEQHRFMKYHGGFNNAGACDPTGGEQLVNFPPTGWDDNYNQILAWIDHNQNPFTTTDELRPSGGTPIAASLRDMRTSILANATADTKTPCRKHQVIVLTDGGESCESVANAVTAAGTFQNMSFTNAAGVNVPDYDVPVYVLGFAVCPPGQPNCQTRQDLNSIAVAGGTGAAIPVSNQLDIQLALAQIVASSVVTERCNNLDDDCDLAIDEDFPGKGAACSAGVGACFRTGTVVCTGDQLGLTCNAVPGTPTAEVCNGIDDNCDGLIDNGINCQGCVPQCSQAAGCDICNGLDEDCDGRIDENFTPGSCGVSTGACDPGTTVCTSGVVSCQGGVGPVMETCNNVDDDCDSIVDGMTQPCYPAATPGCNVATGVCQGICRLGTNTCTAGVFGACAGAVTPGTEIACNGQDDDCDGLVDEGTGTEQCNGQDDDCDGSIDEGVATTDPDIGVACGTPPFVGACHQGTIQCVAGGEQCVGEANPTPEQCNNIDDDCNGVVDNNVPGFGGACGSSTGRCTPGTLQCVNGGPQCIGQTGPFAEICNGLDDNCNGQTDETDPNLGDTCMTLPSGGTVTTETGECQFGILACQSGGLVCVGAIGPATERCNGLDDDCDGTVDNGFPLGQACDNGQPGVCRQTGVYVCAPGGMGVVCTAPAGVPGTESCNNLDDDCDGSIDEGPPPPVGQVCAPAAGTCNPGLWQCVNGVLTCGQPTSGAPEICNGLDDDCDAQIDEAPVPGEGDTCVTPGFEQYQDIGECEFGHTQCLNGAITCVGYIGPQPEVCDGLDNDCDGNPDDQATCPDPNNPCFAGECVLPCGTGEFPCPGNYTCQDLAGPPPGRYCVPDPCAHVTCGVNETCNSQNGQCENLCNNVTCRTGEECRAGFCLDCFDLPDKCQTGELCIADPGGVGQCQPDRCHPNPCAAGDTCLDGTCSSGCSGGCPDGQACVSGTCQPDACADVHCPPPMVCNPLDGQCTNPDCEGVQCGGGQVCVPTTGECEPDPCRVIQCPTDTACVVDPAGRPVCTHGPGRDRVTAAGGGCSTGGGGPPWLLALLALPLARRRRARARGGAA